MLKKNDLDISYTQNRELSWLKFDQRVLEEGRDKNVPLYERLKFISIFTSNLDEFFMIRVGSLYDISLIDSEHYDNKSKMTAGEQLKAIFKSVVPLYEQKDKTFEKVEEELREYNIKNLNIKELNKQEKKFLDDYFKDYILPVLSPQIVDNLHPFPHLQNLSLNLTVLIRNNGNTLVGIVPIPSSVPRVIYIPGEEIKYVLIEKVILEYADMIFNMGTIEDRTIVRVTRNADINPDDENYDIDDDYRLHMKKILKKRGRLAPVRLEVLYKIKPELETYLIDRLNIKKEQVFKCKSPLDMSFVFSIIDKIPVHIKKKITYEDFAPQIPLGINNNESIMSQVARKDILLSYPYEKMDPFLRLIKEAAEDKDVISIKITIYRLARKAKLIEYLTTAAENGKEVTVLMELRARFDEQNNIDWSETLEESGCNVIYGFENFKVHSKICLITKKNNDKIEYITQVGTGNYNEKTAKLYTDLSLITANHFIGVDAANFFKNMSISKLDGHYDYLLVAPISMKRTILKFIDKEIEKTKIGEKGRIILKMNSLTDRELIDKLSEASQAGVKIDMIVRGICCLIPGIKGKTDNITIQSIVGQFLEHSRVYCFGEGKDMKMYIASADYMTRNMDKRVEVGCPIYDEDIKKRILNIINVMLHDNVKGRVLQSDGSYKKRKNESNILINSQEYFIEEAIKNATKQLEIESSIKEKEGIKKKSLLSSHLEEREAEFLKHQQQELESIMEQKKELIKMKEEATEAMREAEEEIKKLLKLQKQIILMNNINAQNKEIAMTLDDFEKNEKKEK